MIAKETDPLGFGDAAKKGLDTSERTHLRSFELTGMSAVEVNSRRALETAQKLSNTFALPRIGLPNWRPRFSNIARSLYALKIGSTRFSSRLRSVLSTSRKTTMNVAATVGPALELSLDERRRTNPTSWE
jgi:hypothetical protein